MNLVAPGNHDPIHVVEGVAPTVFVLLPVHNRRELTGKFIECFVAQTYRDVRLVLIDDGSTDGTGEMVRESLPDVTLLRGDGSWWWSGSMQRGYEWLLQNGPHDEDVVLLANDDITFAPDFTARAVERLRQTPHTLLGARMVDEFGDVIETGVEANLRSFTFRTAHTADLINCLPTRALFMRWADMRRIGGFHPVLLPHYWADYEYTLRAHRLGMRCVTSEEVTICADMNATGYHAVDELVGWQFVRRLFSIKTPLNPVYRTCFALLASSWLWKPINLVNVWLRAGFRIAWQGILRQPFPRKALSGARE